MKVLYDYQAFEMSRYGGVSNCFVKLIASLPSEVDWTIGLKESENEHLKSERLLPELKTECKTERNFIVDFHFPLKATTFHWLERHFSSFPSSYNINRRHSIDLLQSGDYDIFHPTFFDDYFLPYLDDKPFVLTVHDMMPEIFADIYKSSNQASLKKKLCARAAHIIAVSEQTKSDLIRILDVPEDKVTVIYHGSPDYSKRSQSDDSGSRLVGAPYFLYVGRRGVEGKTYKNFMPSVEEFARFVSNTGRKDIKYVCTAEGFSRDEIKRFRDLGVADQMMHVKADDVTLRSLYAGAIAFIYPSLYEGFGIPILEAYREDCPVMLNRKSCFPEIAGDAALYFTLDDNTRDLAELMAKTADMDSNERESLIEKQRRRAEIYSWRQSALQLAQVYENVISRR